MKDEPDEILIPHGTAPTGVGIAYRENVDYLVLLCPDCGGWMTYQESQGPEMTCMSVSGVPARNCGKVRTNFRGIPSEALTWGGSWQQVRFLRGGENIEGVARWVERWTGLTDVTIKIEEK